MTQVDRHAAQAAAQPAKSSGSYGISADVATSEAITPSLVQGAARGPRPDGVASTPNSSAYLGSLLAAKNNTPASTRLLHILETEAVSLDTSLGLQLLDLVAALRLDGKLTPAGQIDKRAYLRPTSLEPIENRLNDFAGMLNVIAEAVGVNLLENDEDTSPVTAKATSRTTGAPAVTSWAETTTGKDRVVQPVHDLPDSPAAQKVMKRPLGLAQLTDILESAQKLNVPSDGRHHVDTPDAPAGSSVQHPGQASARMRAINTDEPVFGRPSLRSSAPPNQQWHLGFWETDRSRQEAPSSSSAEYRPSTGVYFPPRPWAPTTTSGFAPYAHAYPYGPRSAYNPSSHHQSALYSRHSAGDWASNPYVPSWSTAEQRPMPPVFPFSRQFAFGDASPPRSVPHRHYQDYPNANSRAQDSLRSSWEARK